MQESYQHTPRKDSRPHNERFPRHEGTSYLYQIGDWENSIFPKYETFPLIDKIKLHIDNGAPLDHIYFRELIEKLKECDKKYEEMINEINKEIETEREEYEKRSNKINERIEEILKRKAKRKENHLNNRDRIKSILKTTNQKKKKQIELLNEFKERNNLTAKYNRTIGGYFHHNRIKGFSYSFYKDANGDSEKSPYEKNRGNFTEPDDLTLIQKIEAHINKEIGMPLHNDYLLQAKSIIEHCDKKIKKFKEEIILQKEENKIYWENTIKDLEKKLHELMIEEKEHNKIREAFQKSLSSRRSIKKRLLSRRRHLNTFKENSTMLKRSTSLSREKKSKPTRSHSVGGFTFLPNELTHDISNDSSKQSVKIGGSRHRNRKNKMSNKTKKR